jgi:hypothetical protein
VRGKCGVFAADTRVGRGAFIIQKFLNQEIPLQVLRRHEKITAAVRLSLGPPQWPDAVHARDARMNI